MWRVPGVPHVGLWRRTVQWKASRRLLKMLESCVQPQIGASLLFLASLFERTCRMARAPRNSWCAGLPARRAAPIVAPPHMVAPGGSWWVVAPQLRFFSWFMFRIVLEFAGTGAGGPLENRHTRRGPGGAAPSTRLRALEMWIVPMIVPILVLCSGSWLLAGL